MKGHNSIMHEQLGSCLTDLLAECQSLKAKTEMAHQSTDESLLQIAKLLIIPFVCLVELFWLKRRFAAPVVCSILVVVAGVAIV